MGNFITRTITEKLKTKTELTMSSIIWMEQRKFLRIAEKLEGFEGFHFHQLRHTYTSNLLANRAAPKDVQELLGHSDVSSTMNVYAHSIRKAKRESARLSDKVVGND